ncbi:MAG: periplasmic heavy metal sensor [Deltaproteobacteria bacterium]|nr:periplasmic heavy metal sensor [Deltaproteobacteria bacterium]
MKVKAHILSVVISLMLTGLFLVPALVQAKEDSWGEMHKMHRATAVKELKLSPEKAKEFNAVEEKYVKDRQELVDRLKKSQAELQNAMAGTPDEAKIKGLVSAIRADQDKMAQSFKSQFDEELALMTPVQQGQYLLTLHKWREEMMDDHMKMKQK